MLPGDPGVPHQVHLGEGRDVGEIDRRGQDPRLVAARGSQQALDFRQHLARLAGNALVRIPGHLPCEVHRVAVHDGLRHARAALQSLDHRPDSLGLCGDQCT
jgi:hypothetical protein